MGLRSHRSRTYVMDSGRAFQLREQVIRRHRLVLGICGLFVLVFACVVVAMVLKYALGNGAFSQADTERELHVMGGWGEWLSWTTCTKTCGGGHRSRRRYCNDPEPETNGAPCDGQYELKVSCSDWPCPDCTRECPQGHLSNCSYCVCAMTSLGGSVRDVTGTPINDVKVYLYNMQWRPIATSNPTGEFILENVCLEERVLIFKKMGYHSAYIDRSTAMVNDTHIDVVLNKLRRRKIVTHPQSTALYEGATLTLTCWSDSPKVKYEWFKDGNILSLPSERSGSKSHLSARLPKLVIRNVQQPDKGVYRCRIVSAGGMMFSRPATVTVTARNVRDNCQPKPLKELHHLPMNCSIHGVKMDAVDIGYCQPQSCATHTPPRGKDSQQRLCCGPIKTNTSYVKCDGWSYPIVQTLLCGCSISCGVNTVDKRPVTGQTYLHDLLDGNSVTTQAFLTYDNQLIGTSKSGSFTLTVPSNTSEIIIQVPAGPLWNPTVKVTSVLNRADDIYLILQRKASPIRVHSSKKMVFPVTSAWMTSRPLVSIVLPGGTIVDRHGNNYDDIVDVYTQFLDPRSSEDILSAPGTFLYYTKEGQSFQLEVLGIILLYVESKNGTGLEINSRINVTLDADGLEIENEIGRLEGIRNFILDHDTGQWEIAEEHWRRQCDGKGICSHRLLCNVDIHKGVRFIMAARPIPNANLCAVKVATLQDALHREPLPGRVVQIQSQRGPHTVHVTRAVTDTYGTACLKVPCGCQHVISTQGLKPSLNPHLPDGLSYVTDLIKKTVSFSSWDGHLIRTGAGPLHLNSAHTCEVRHDGEYVFDFISDRQSGDLRSLQGTYLMMAVEPRANYPLSWHRLPEDNPQRSACAVKLHVQGTSKQSRVFSISRQNHSQGDLLGTYNGGMYLDKDHTYAQSTSSDYSGLFTCLSVKCPFNGADKDEVYSQFTHVTIYVVDVVLQSCRRNSSKQGPLKWEEDQSDRGYKALHFLINPSDISSTQSKSGFFQARGRGGTAEQWAMHQCMTSQESAAHITCGKTP